MGASTGGRAHTELPADHELGAALVDTVQTLVCVLDRDGRIVRFNRACERATGFAAAEVVGCLAADTVIPPEELDSFEMVMARIRDTRASSPEQGHWTTRDGGRRVIAWANRPLLDEDGEVRYIVTSGLDVTDSETATAELWALQGQLRDRLAELQRLAAEQAALRRVATLVAREPGSEEVFAAVTLEASRLLGADSGLLLCYDDDHETGKIVGRYSEIQTTAFALGTVLPVEGGSLTSTVLRTGEAGRLDAYEDVEGEIARRVRESQYHSVVAAPVVVAGRIWGLLVAGTQRPEPLPAGAETRLESFAELVALALASAEARSELASRAPFPVGLDVPAERFTHGVEVAVYYLVSEALTNAAKYAEPSTVCVSVEHADGTLVAEIDDDGRGGADPAAGSGLRGLADRVEAIGGRLRIDSPPGRGTRIRAELPLR
jgi:PAS domain S-box-containing protein